MIRGVYTYELLLSQDTRVEAAPDDDSILHAEMAFVPIEDLVVRPLGSYVDLLAIVVEIGEVDCVVGKNEKVQTKRDILIIDSSNVQVLCTLWNDFASLPNDNWLHKVIAIRHGRLTSFQGRSIGTTAKTMIISNLGFPDKHEPLECWFDENYSGQALPINLLICSFTSIDKIHELPSDNLINVIGLVTSVAEAHDVETIEGRTLHKRAITLADFSTTAIDCTLWGSNADRVDGSWKTHVLAITNARFNDYNGRSISSRTTSSVLLDPPIERAENLVEWYQLKMSSTGTSTLRAPLDAKQSQIEGRAAAFAGEPGATSSSFSVRESKCSADHRQKSAWRGKDDETKTATPKRRRSK